MLTELNNEPIHTTTLLVDPNISYPYIITLPTHSQPIYGFTLLASRQVRWSASIPDTMTPPFIPKDTRKTLLLQLTTITRRNVNTPRSARDACTIYYHAFQENFPPTTACSSGRLRYIPYSDTSPAKNIATRTLQQTGKTNSPPTQDLIQI